MKPERVASEVLSRRGCPLLGRPRRPGKQNGARKRARGKGERKHAAAEEVRHKCERVVGLRKWAVAALACS